MDRKIVIIIPICIFVTFILGIVIVGSYLGLKVDPLQVASTSIRNGTIHGRVVPTGLPDVWAEQYIGIPYAKPPVGELRYSDPQPWMEDYEDGVLEAVDTRSMCWNLPLLDLKMSEDCLYLNVWTPHPKPNNTKLAVMVFIHGGGFTLGSSFQWEYNGKTLAGYGEVVVVSMNYRLGNFGFLSSGDGKITGNFGLKDQQLALQWVQDNIADFGGDTDSVTIFGESAGAASVGYHLLSPGSTLLFHRAILESGSPDGPWGYSTPQLMQQKFGHFLEDTGCPDDDEVLDCIRNVKAYDLNKQESEWNILLNSKQFMEDTWTPTNDGNFILDSPHMLLQNPIVHVVDKQILLGTNKNEGSMFMVLDEEYFSHMNWYGAQTSQMQYNISIDAILPDGIDLSLMEDILAEYSHDLADTAANRDALIDMVGDYQFKCPVRALADALSSSAERIYMYELTYRHQNEWWPQWCGVVHAAELQYVFGHGFGFPDKVQLTDGELEFSKRIMGYWSSFAKSGRPEYSQDEEEWTPFSAPLEHSQRQYLELSGVLPADIRLKDTDTDTQCALWKRAWVSAYLDMLWTPNR